MAINLQERVGEILRDQKGVKPIDLAKVAGVTKGLVSQWVNGPAKSMSYEAAKRINAKWGYSIEWLKNGKGPKMAAVNPASSEGEYSPKEQILVELYRGLFGLQQQHLVAGLWALFEANQITRKELGNKPLNGVRDEDVRAAFGDAPFHLIKKIKKQKRPAAGGRDLGDAMGDFFDP